MDVYQSTNDLKKEQNEETFTLELLEIRTFLFLYVRSYVRISSYEHGFSQYLDKYIGIFVFDEVDILIVDSLV